MTGRLTCAILVVSLLGAREVTAQPAPPTGDKGDAKALMQTGVRLLETENYLAALAIFKEAFEKYPSAKILLNIGTTLKLLDRKADAANAYQRYLDSPDTDPARRAEVTAAITELDKTVGRVEVTVTPPDAEVKLTDEWMPAAKAKVWRVMPGTVTVHARREGYTPNAKLETVDAGKTVAMTIELALPTQVLNERGSDDLMVVEHDQPRSRVGALAVVHVSVHPKIGSAWLVGATADITPALSIDAAVLLGPGLISDGMATLSPPSFGGYLGASFAFMTDKVRPRLGAGMPVFASDGARFFLRAAGGVEYVASRHISLTVELGAEIALNPEADINEIAVVPALGVTGRL